MKASAAGKHTLKINKGPSQEAQAEDCEDLTWTVLKKTHEKVWQNSNLFAGRMAAYQTGLLGRVRLIFSVCNMTVTADLRQSRIGTISFHGNFNKAVRGGSLRCHSGEAEPRRCEEGHNWVVTEYLSPSWWPSLKFCRKQKMLTISLHLSEKCTFCNFVCFWCRNM